MSRRIDRGLLSLVPTLLLFLAFGAARVVAPVGLIGLVFHDPWHFVIAGVVLGLGGVALLFIRPIEVWVARVMAPSRLPTDAERDRIAPLLERVGERAGLDPARLIVRVIEDGELNAAAGAAHVMFVTTGSLHQPDDELEALLAHELGHHRGLHPLGTALIWWLSLPGEALMAVYRVLRRVAMALTRRVRPLAVVAQALLILWQVSVMWLYFIAQLLAFRAERLSEFAADRAAAQWGYADALAGVLADAPEPEAEGLRQRLLATHPPVEERIAALAERAG